MNAGRSHIETGRRSVSGVVPQSCAIVERKHSVPGYGMIFSGTTLVLSDRGS